MEVYSHCNAPQHQSTACTIQFFDTLLNIQLFSHSVATRTEVHQHFKQGISHSGTIWPPWENTRSTGADVARTHSSLQNRGVSKRYSFTANILGCNSSASKSSMLIAVTYFARTASGESVVVVVIRDYTTSKARLRQELSRPKQRPRHQTSRPRPRPRPRH